MPAASPLSKQFSSSQSVEKFHAAHGCVGAASSNYCYAEQAASSKHASMPQAAAIIIMRSSSSSNRSTARGTLGVRCSQSTPGPR